MNEVAILGYATAAVLGLTGSAGIYAVNRMKQAMWGEVRACKAAERFRDERDEERRRRREAEERARALAVVLKGVISDAIKREKELSCLPTPPPSWTKRERRLLKALFECKRKHEAWK